MHGADVKSDLEGAVLGVIGARGPLTPYAVLDEFARSPSSHWSAGTGAIYPAIDRLIRRGLVKATQRHVGRRASRLCCLTPKGRRALAVWVGPPLPASAAAVTYDPIRTRVSFLFAVTPRARTAMLGAAEAALRRELVTLRRLASARERAGDRWEAMATWGAVEENRGRLRWVTRVRRMLAAPRAR